jgi:predicted phage-related endonuclease
MAMQILNLVQGSDEWKAIRTKYCVASEAPVIMGASPYMKRDELLRLKTTGVEREISEWVEKFIFKRGHETEALARPIAEESLGEELYSLTGVSEISGLKLLASFDGITAPLYDIHWEHKQFNRELFERVRFGGELEERHYWQLEHQLLVNGNDTCIFAVSDGTEENYAELRYTSQLERRERLIAGWKLFLQDLVNYIPPAVEVKPVGAVIKELPALVVEISGEVKSSNLVIYKANALDFIKNIKTELVTDQDFADAENVVKFCDRVEKELEVVKKATLSQAQSIDEVVRTIDQLKDEMRQKRLMLEKLVAKEKESRKAIIINTAKTAFAEHIATCNAALSDSGTNVRMPDITADFVGAAKSKRTLETLRSACNDELARAKIEANRILNHIDVNLGVLLTLAANHKFLFADIQQLILKDKEALEAIAKQRIAEHEAQEAARIKAEAQRIADEAAKNQVAEAQAQLEIAAAPEPVEETHSTISSQAVDTSATTSSMITLPGETNLYFDAPEPIADMSDFIRGKHVGFKIALGRYRECKQSGADFEQVIQSLIHATQSVNKAA